MAARGDYTSAQQVGAIGAFLLGTLESAWGQHVDFHLNTLDFRFCQANLEDLQHQTAGPQQHHLRDRVHQSTVVFFGKS